MSENWVTIESLKDAEPFSRGASDGPGSGIVAFQTDIPGFGLGKGKTHADSVWTLPGSESQPVHFGFVYHQHRSLVLDPVVNADDKLDRPQSLLSDDLKESGGFLRLRQATKEEITQLAIAVKRNDAKLLVGDRAFDTAIALS